MSEQKPNHICRVCGKQYYACLSCDKINHWKSVACCPEHYVKYVDLVTKERNKVESVEHTIENTGNEIDKKIDEVVVEATDNKKETSIKKKFIRNKISEETSEL